MNPTSDAMRNRRFSGSLWVAGAFALSLSVCVCQQASAQGNFNVFTRAYNSQRTGANLSEIVLTQANVNSGSFGKLFSLAVDDQVYAGILYVSSLQIAGGIHNVIYVATVNNSIYAFDADTLGVPLWQKNFNGTGRPTNNSDFGVACPGGYFDFRGNIGIVGTPVIDGVAGTMYFVTRTVESAGTVQRLHAIDITTGNDRANSPKVITASVTGTGDGGSTVVFNSITQNQRPALAFSQGTVYIAWASYCDITPYHGWVMAYDGTALTQLGAFNDTPNGVQGGIWMAGAGILLDLSGNLFASTGNGTADATQDFGESVVKLAPNTLNRLDFYTASNYNTLNAGDTDFGSGGPSLLPGYNLLVTGGKEGRLYLLNTNNLGGLVAGDTQIPQVFQAVDPTVRPSATHHIHSSNPAWNSPQGLNVYVWGENDFLHGYRFNTTTQIINTVPFATGAILPPVGMPGGVMTLSANGSQTGTGILWATTPRNGDANEFTVPGQLYAFNAETLALLWQSTGVMDDSLNMSKGSHPLVANGKVYVANLSRFVSVYGPRTTMPPSQNLALNKPATGSTACNSNETPDKAVNGSYSLGLSDKWCSQIANAFLQVDLGAPVTVNRFLIEHAGAGGGESFNFNTAAFNIQVSTDGVNFTTVVNVTGNVDSITTHDITPTTARYVKLNVTTPTHDGDIASRIYEFQVYNAPDYSVSVVPTATTVTAGSAANITVSQTASGNFNGTVSYAISGLPAGATATFTPSVIAGSGSSILNIATTSATAAGTYSLVVTGTSGTLQHTANLSLTVVSTGADFGLAATPASQSVTAGNRAAFTATVNALNGFTGTVTLTAAGLPAGATASFSPATITSAGSSTLTISTTAVAAAGTYPLVITGISGTLQHTANVSLTVVKAADFGFAATPASQSVTAGNSGTFTATVNALNGFTGTVTLTAAGLPAGATASFSPATITSAGSSTLTISTTAATAAGTYPLVITGTSGTLQHTANVSLTVVKPADFGLSAAPASQSVTAGNSATFTATVTALNGFAGTVTLAASGVPAGATASFNPASITSAGSSILTVSTTAATAAGTYSLTVTGTSGALLHSALLGLTVTASTGGTSVPVSLTAVFNKTGIVSDGSTFTLGLDGYGFAYSSNLLGAAQNINGISYNIGPAGAPNVVSNAVIPLPVGTFGALRMLAAGVNGSQVAQVFTVKYTDGTVSTITQSLSDWFVSNSYAGETLALAMPYRDTYSGAKDNRVFNLYGYSFPLNQSKTVSSITLPANNNVAVLAITLVPAAPVSLALAYNRNAFDTDGATFTSGGLDGYGFAYSANLLGTTQTVNGIVFNIGPANVPNSVANATVTLPAGNFSALKVLATGVNGLQTSQTVTVNYTDGSSTPFVQSFSDWFVAGGYSGETTAVTMAYRNVYNGTKDARTFLLYGYSFALNVAKTVESITLPANSNVVVLAITAIP